MYFKLVKFAETPKPHGGRKSFNPRFARLPRRWHGPGRRNHHRGQGRLSACRVAIDPATLQHVFRDIFMAKKHGLKWENPSKKGYIPWIIPI